MDPVTSSVLKCCQLQLKEVLDSAVIVGVPKSDGIPVIAIYGYADDLQTLSKAVRAKMEGVYRGPEFDPLLASCMADIVSRVQTQLMTVMSTGVLTGVPLEGNLPVLVSFGDAEALKVITRVLEIRMETSDEHSSFGPAVDQG